MGLGELLRGIFADRAKMRDLERRLEKAEQNISLCSANVVKVAECNVKLADSLGKLSLQRWAAGDEQKPQP